MQFAGRIRGELTGAWRRDLDHAIEISVPLAEKDILHLDVDVPAVIFGEPIRSTDDVSDFEIRLDGLSSICRYVRCDVVPRFEGFFS